MVKEELLAETKLPGVPHLFHGRIRVHVEREQYARASAHLLSVVMGIGVVIGFSVVCLSMYMAVLQRTREIGILKSLGASKGFILRIIWLEALLLGVGGTLARHRHELRRLMDLIGALVPASIPMEIVPDWWPIAGAITWSAPSWGRCTPGSAPRATIPSRRWPMSNGAHHRSPRTAQDLPRGQGRRAGAARRRSQREAASSCPSSGRPGRENRRCSTSSAASPRPLPGRCAWPARTWPR